MDLISSQRYRVLTGIVAMLALSAATVSGQSRDDRWNRFRVTSSRFTNGSTLPLSAVNDIPNASGNNSCTASGAPGGNKSPELSWSDAPRGTRSFVVVTYDVTAAFTHWGMYNIPGDATGVPENAGVAGSSYGSQIVNDFEVAAEYDGPCPPANVSPDVHRYVFTVYALDIDLVLPSSTNFPANAETLYHALISTGIENHILARASIEGSFSATP